MALLSCCGGYRILPETWEDCAGAMEAEHALEVRVLCADSFESLGIEVSVMADDVLMSAAKSKRESRAFMLESENRNAQVLVHSYREVEREYMCFDMGIVERPG